MFDNNSNVLLQLVSSSGAIASSDKGQQETTVTTISTTTTTTTTTTAPITLMNLMSSTYSAAEYYNELSAIISKSSSNASSACSSTRVLSPNLSCTQAQQHNTNQINTSQQSSNSSQISTSHSRDSSFIVEPSTTTTIEHCRYPSNISNDERLLRSCGSSISSNANTSNASSMVAIDFSSLTRNSPSTIGGMKTSTNSVGHNVNQYGQTYPFTSNSNNYTTHYDATSSMYSSTGTSRSHEEDIYEDLCYVTLRSNREKSLGPLLLAPIEKRDYCIKELVETEKNYCEALRMIINHFYQPLSKVLPNDDRRIIFNNLKSLTELHTLFYNELFRACSNNVASNSNNANNCTTMLSANLTQPTTPTNLIPSASMPSLSLIGTNGAMTNGAYVADSISSVNQNSTFGSLSSFSSTLLLPSLANNSGTNLNSTPPRLYSCFLTFKDKFLMYGEYCANLPKAQALLDELMTRDEIMNQCVARCQNKANDGKFKLRDLLSLPMQRILKYHLLLGELIRSTAETHEDYAGLKQAHDMMLDIGGYINEVKRDTETLEIIADIQRSIVDLSMPDNYELKDYGRLLKDGEVRLRSHDDPKMRLKNRYVFVFDKVVLMCKALRGLQYSYKEAIILEEFKIEEICAQSPISKLTKQWSHGWALVHVRTKQMFTFYDAKRKWLESIERAQDNVRPKDLLRTNHRFQMSNVPQGEYCMCCEKLLRGTWYQGYHCSVCNVFVHKTCLASVKSCEECANPTVSHSTIHVRKDSLLSHSETIGNEVNLRAGKSGSRPGSSAYRSQTCRSMYSGAPPTPSRTNRIIAKAISTNYGGNGQLAFVPNDTILVFSKHGTASWFGRNTRTEEEGTFSGSMVTELTPDSPASSSLESPTVVSTCGSGPRFSYEDPFGSVNEQFAFPVVPAATLPRKFSTLSNSNMNGSNRNESTMITSQPMLMPSSPLAASTPVLNQTSGSNSGNVFNFNAEAEANAKLMFGNGFNLEEYAWFAGPMDRDTSHNTLNPLPNGSFMVRISPKQKNNYAISIKYNGQVKHMRVCITEQAGVTPTTVHSNLHSPDSIASTIASSNGQWPYRCHYYLSETRYFRTIVDLVRWYQLNSLSESFNMVNTQLALPYKKAYCTEMLGHAVALYAFTGTSSASSSFLSLRKGDRIAVLSRAAETKGWWKGEIGDRLGYFPFKYVSPSTPSLAIFNSSDGNGNFSNSLSINNKSVPFGSFELNNAANTSLATTTDSISLSSALTETSNLSPITDQSFSALTNTNSVMIADKMSPSISPSFSSQSNSSTSSSPTTLSSPVNSDTSSMHSRQASSDAGIEVPPFSGSNQSPPPPSSLVPSSTSIPSVPVTCFNSLSLTHHSAKS
ncbi:Guanine nucleotide exchange factor vav2 [Blomia tropicalis]|nr:Guanine nucleotide exchange factor vav2 [Blomia tropicalis]